MGAIRVTGEEELRSLLATAGKILYSQGLVDYLGHSSVRAEGTERIVVKPKHSVRIRSVANVHPSQMLVVDLDGNIVESAGTERPPREIFIHTEIYRARKDVNAVVHTHQPMATLLGVLGAELLPLLHGQAAITAGGISTWPRALLVSNPGLGRELAASLGKHSFCHLRGHGIVSVGPDIKSATVGAIALEQLAEANIYALQCGRTPHLIDAMELEVLQTELAGVAGRWAYYEQIADGGEPRPVPLG